MNRFEEFLQDYEAHEAEKTNKFMKRLDEGKVAQNENYPPKERFIKLKEPIAEPFVNIWGVVPFYGSTIAKLMPKDSKKAFDEAHEFMGFNSGKIDEMMDFQKETGRIQFSLTMPPTYYKNLEFLEPLFRELEPPTLSYDHLSFVGEEFDKKYNIEFKTLAEFGFNRYIERATKELGNSNLAYTKAKLDNYANNYSVLKASGHEELADEIGTLMLIDHSKAYQYLILFGILISNPQKSLFKPICNFDKSFIDFASEFGNPYGIGINNDVPYEIGKFLLNKTTFYPETMSGCNKVIQEYDDQELHKVLGALNDGVRRTNIDVIEDKKIDMSEILDNVWNDAERLRMGAAGIRFGVSLNLGLIGEIAAGLPGMGIMAGLGFTAVDNLWGMQNDSVSEKIAKFVSPNYLVSIYDFKKKHALKD